MRLFTAAFIILLLSVADRILLGGQNFQLLMKLVGWIDAGLWDLFRHWS
jgi:hypothetical protein